MAGRQRPADTSFTQMRGPGYTPERGAELLIQHVYALAADVARQRRPRDRVSDRIGRPLSDLLVNALTSDQGMRRRDGRA
jgi:hypothetical protein